MTFQELWIDICQTFANLTLVEGLILVTAMFVIDEIVSWLAGKSLDRKNRR